MAALVPYAAGELFKAAGSPTAMEIGMAVGQALGTAAASKTSEYFRRDKPKAYSARKPKKKGRNMGRVGERVGSANTKWDTLSVDYTNMTPETKNQLQLLNIVKTDGSSAYDRRLKDQLNFRGIKFCMNFRCEGALGTAKAMLNIAVISPKADLTSNTAIPNTDFFRDPTGTRRSIDFGDAALNSLDYYCNAINTDKYVVHKRLKHLIGPAGSSEGMKEKYLEFYVPVNRQIRYEATTANPEGKNMYLVWWFSASDGGTPLNSVRFAYRVTRYFKETVGI